VSSVKRHVLKLNVSVSISKIEYAVNNFVTDAGFKNISGFFSKKYDFAFNEYTESEYLVDVKLYFLRILSNLIMRDSLDF
jgi:hypothetical protein